MEKKFIYYVLLLFLLYLLQSSALTVFGQNIRFVPQLTMILVVIFALTHTFPEVLWFSFIAGFLLEFFSGFFWGSYVIAMIITGLASYYFTRRLAKQELSGLLIGFFVIFGTLFFGFWIFLYDLLMSLFDLSVGMSVTSWLTPGVFWTVLINLIFLYPILWVYKFLPK